MNDEEVKRSVILLLSLHICSVADIIYGSFIDRYIPGYVFFSQELEKGLLVDRSREEQMLRLYLHLTIYIDEDRNVVDHRELRTTT